VNADVVAALGLASINSPQQLPGATRDDAESSQAPVCIAAIPPLTDSMDTFR
jgi:hypothetical protein